ncbi:hypothetical protein CLOM_g20115 [Closterium sp. NIES-68]|nr:hypothetical protein CLOM_g20115 [Closterium sp. NIES-68]GJP64136.1 hypothetical protein CLOP_g21157 [Closterium sp. NIES-67]
MATCVSSRASPATQSSVSGPSGLGPSSSFVLSVDMFDAPKNWQQQQRSHPPSPLNRGTGVTAVKSCANAGATGGSSAQNSAARTTGAGAGAAVNSSSFHLGPELLLSGGERICPIPCVDWREAARKAEETRMLSSEVCPIPAQNWRKDARRADEPHHTASTSTLSSTPSAAAAAEVYGSSPGKNEPSSEREARRESASRTTTTKHQPPSPVGAFSRPKASSVGAATSPESESVPLSEDAAAASGPGLAVVLSARSQLRENESDLSSISRSSVSVSVPIFVPVPVSVSSPTTSTCSHAASVISTFSLGRRSSFSSSSSSGSGGGCSSRHGDFTPPISRCSTLLGSASSTIDENDVPCFAGGRSGIAACAGAGAVAGTGSVVFGGILSPRQSCSDAPPLDKSNSSGSSASCSVQRRPPPSLLLGELSTSSQSSSQPRSPRRSADYLGDDGGAAFSRVSTAPYAAGGGRRPPRLVAERLRHGDLPNRTSSLPLGALDSPTAAAAAAAAVNTTTNTVVSKCSSLANSVAYAPPVVSAASVSCASAARDVAAGEVRRVEQWLEEKEGTDEGGSHNVADSACLNWEDVEELCHRMDIAGIRIETMDIQPVADDHVPSPTQGSSSRLSHAAARGADTATTPHTTTAAAANCASPTGALGSLTCTSIDGDTMSPTTCSLNNTRATRPGARDACGGAASVVAIKFGGMHMWYYPGDNVKGLFRDAVQW